MLGQGDGAAGELVRWSRAGGVPGVDTPPRGARERPGARQLTGGLRGRGSVEAVQRLVSGREDR